MRTTHSYHGACGDQIVLNDQVHIFELTMRPHPDAPGPTIHAELTYDQAVAMREAVSS